MKLWVDDIRPAPEGWVLVKTISEAINFLSRYRGEITHVSLDHDISIPVMVGDVSRPYPSPDTFKVVAMFMCEMVSFEELIFRDAVITTHSSNPEGRKAIVNIFADRGIKCEETPLERANR